MVAAVETERQRVERWRADLLGRAGYEPEAAELLAICVDVDLHLAVRLIEQGCEQRVALRILL